MFIEFYEYISKLSESSQAQAKGQLISKANCQDSPIKRTNEFAVFDLKSCYVVKSNAVRSFFLENLIFHQN